MTTQEQKQEQNAESVNIYDRNEEMVAWFDNYIHQLQRLSMELRFLNSDRMMDCSAKVAGQLLALYETEVEELLEHLTEVYPIVLANRLQPLKAMQERLRNAVDSFVLDRTDRGHFARKFGNKLAQQRKNMGDTLKEELLPRIRFVVDDIYAKTTPAGFKHQLTIFCNSNYYAQQRKEFQKMVEDNCAGYSMENGTSDASQDEEEMELHAFNETLETHPVYGAILHVFPSLHCNEEKLKESIEMMLQPVDEEKGVGRWWDLLTAVALKEESVMRAKKVRAKNKYKRHNVPEETLRKAIQTMCDDKSIKYQYDFAWLMAIMNERKQFPHFTSADEFKEKMVKWEIRRVPSGSILEKYLPDTTVDFPDWRYSDDKGRDRSSRRGKEERLRRQKLVEHFLELVGMKPQ